MPTQQSPSRFARALRELARRDPKDLLSICFEALNRHRLRTALSVLGIILGVAAVIAMLSVTTGARDRALRQVEMLGLRNIVVHSRLLSAAEGAQGAAGLTVGDMQRLSQTVPLTTVVTPLVSRYMQVHGPLRNRTATVLGVSSDYAGVMELVMARGRFLSRLDDDPKARACVLGNTLVRSLFGYRDPIGQPVQLQDTWYRVVGVLQSRASIAGNIGPITPRDLNHAALIPLAALLGHAVDANPEQPIEQIWIQASDGDRVGDIEPLVQRTLAWTRRGIVDYDIVVPRQLLNQRFQTQRTFNIVIGSIAIISLVVGGIGIMNVMLASVLERTAEIGLRRVVGATHRDVFIQFLSESLMMTVAGGAMGIVLGVALSWSITAYAGWDTRVSAASVLLGLAVSLSVGVIFGSYPAVRAARLQPIDALRYE